MSPVEHIVWNDKTLATIVRAQINPQQTTFVTPPEFNQQVGFIVYREGQEIPRHQHRPVERHFIGTSEVIVLLRGRFEIDVYNDQQSLVATRELSEGDLIIVVAGGHGYRMLADTVLLEIK